MNKGKQNQKIILIGVGGHSKSVVDSIEDMNEYEIIGFTDSFKKTGYKDYPILGTDDDLELYYKKGIHNVFITIGFMGKGRIRNNIYTKLKKIGYQIPSIIDKTAICAKNVIIEEGVFIGKGAILNSEVQIGKMAIINSGAIIEHESKVGDFSHIAVGGVICGNCKIGKNTLIGANATVIQEKDIGDNVIIGAGAVVIQDITSNTIAYGNPCKKVGNVYE